MRIGQKLKQVITHYCQAAKKRTRAEVGRERPASYYDEVFCKIDRFNVHYAVSCYYPVWIFLIERLRKAGSGPILEIGCGTGQLAAALYDAKLPNAYCGFDFSKVAVQKARERCPHYTFLVADALKTDIYTSMQYDIVIATEVLEHINADLDLIRRIRAGARLFASVPNTPWPSHVRHFDHAKQVTDRYAGFFDMFSVKPFHTSDDNIIFFFEGVKK